MISLSFLYKFLPNFLNLSYLIPLNSLLLFSTYIFKIYLIKKNIFFKLFSNRMCKVKSSCHEKTGYLLMPAVTLVECIWRDSRARVSRDEIASATLFTLAPSSWFWHMTRGDSQAMRHETLWVRYHGPLKKRELTRRDTSAQGYTRVSEVRWVFPSTFSLLRYLGFSRRECIAGTGPTIYSSYFVRILRVFLQNILWNTKHPLYTFCISFKFRVCEKINDKILLTFRENATSGAKWYKMQNARKKMQNAKKVMQNTLLYTFLFRISQAFHDILW